MVNVGKRCVWVCKVSCSGGRQNAKGVGVAVHKRTQVGKGVGVVGKGRGKMGYGGKGW